MLIQIRIIFNVMDHINYKKGVSLGLPICRSVLKNFLQNLEGKFIKSRSKSKVLIHYPTGCPRRHCTPYLFHPTCTVWIPQIPVGTQGPHRALCVFTSSVTFSVELMCSRHAGISKDDSQRRDGAQAAVRCTQVGTT